MDRLVLLCVFSLLLPLRGVGGMDVTCTAGQNCTTILQSAFTSGESTIFIQPGVYEVGPLFLSRSNLHVTFAPGSVLLAQRGSFHGGADCLLTIADGDNITVVAYGSEWIMRKQDYINTTQG